MLNVLWAGFCALSFASVSLHRSSGEFEASVSWISQLNLFLPCRSSGKVFTVCCLRQPRRTSAKTLNSTPLILPPVTPTSTPAVCAHIRSVQLLRNNYDNKLFFFFFCTLQLNFQSTEREISSAVSHSHAGLKCLPRSSDLFWIFSPTNATLWFASYLLCSCNISAPEFLQDISLYFYAVFEDSVRSPLCLSPQVRHLYIDGQQGSCHLERGGPIGRSVNLSRRGEMQNQCVFYSNLTSTSSFQLLRERL